MAEQLLDVLQHALREHWQDDRVAKAMSKRSFCKRLRLQASLQCLLSSVPVAQAAGQGSTPQRVVEFRPPSASVGKGSVKESVRPSKGGAKGTGKHPRSGPRAIDAKGGHTERRDSARAGKGAIVDINPQEWERSAIPTTKQAILGAVGEGKAPPGTVVSVGDAEDVLELRDAWKALSRYEPLTILLDQPGVESLQGINVIKARAGVPRAGSSWAVEDLRLFATGDSQQAPFARRPELPTCVSLLLPRGRRSGWSHLQGTDVTLNLSWKPVPAAIVSMRLQLAQGRLEVVGCWGSGL